MSLKTIFLERVIGRIRKLLSQGLSPEKLALTIAIGVCLAAFPVIGATTALCTGAALAFRLNMPLIQAINYFGAPLQVGLLIPLIRLGEKIFGGNHLKLSLSEILHVVATKPLEAIHLLWDATMKAVGAWALTAPFAGAIVFFLLVPILRGAADRLTSRREAQAAR